MRRQIQEILHGYGQQVEVCRGDHRENCRAFLQPVTERREQEAERMTPLGAVDRRLWMYLGDAEVCSGDRIFWNGTEFCVRSSRPFCAGEVVLYWWAALERAKEAVS